MATLRNKRREKRKRRRKKSEREKVKQDTERTLQHLENRRNQDLHIIKDLGGVDDGGLEGVALGCKKTEKKTTPEKIFGFRVGGGGGGSGGGGVASGIIKTRNPLHFLDLKLRVSRRHKSTENLTPTHSHPHPPHPHHAHVITPMPITTLQRCDNNNNNSSDEEHTLHQHRQTNLRTESSYLQPQSSQSPVQLTNQQL
ncbi:hypothetical protein Pcinc_014190 [Petrolisthes cinctipes]|uniref:Uncharacterized protein n=1 Tax=Petrolisthes cinctipes TaxID=88211 RepID=A0AAE1G0U5_PETCI|nr:hypothetical protein Pcinc_014190 [Petrolisthes cinctipes]